jgi:hypothetical protein
MPHNILLLPSVHDATIRYDAVRTDTKNAAAAPLVNASKGRRFHPYQINLDHLAYVSLQGEALHGGWSKQGHETNKIGRHLCFLKIPFCLKLFVAV